MFSLRQNCLEAAKQLTPGEKHAPLALQAFQPDISSQAYYFPFVSTTRMGLAQTYNIVQV